LKGPRPQAPEAAATAGTIALSAGASQDVDSALRAVLSATVATLGFDGGGIYLIDADGLTASVRYCQQLPPDFVAETRVVNVREGPYRELFLDDHPLFVEHYERLAPALAAKYGFKSIASVPLTDDGRVVGALNVACSRQSGFTAEQRRALVAIGRDVGGLLAKLNAAEARQSLQSHLEAVVEASQNLVLVVGKDRRVLYGNAAVRRALGYVRADLEGMRIAAVHPRQCRREALRAWADMSSGRTSSCILPLVTSDGVLLAVETLATHGTWDGLEVVFAKCRPVDPGRPRDVVDSIFVGVAWQRDPRVAAHELRVACLADLVAVQLGLGDEARDLAVAAAEVHDVGKAESTAMQPSGPSSPSDPSSPSGASAHADATGTPTEGHPRLGRDLLVNLGVGEPIPEIVLQHHERPDGSGYPAGLRGDAIRLEASIVAVADAAENLLRGRFGGKAAAETAARLRAGAGSAFHAEAAQACALIVESDFYEPPLCLDWAERASLGAGPRQAAEPG